LAELEGNLAFVDQFNDGTQNGSNLPFIPDPDGLELNRLAIISEAIEDVRITAGRQRIALDDWRFIGAFPFRQNDQTYDAIRLETTSLGPGTLDVGYIGRVLRPLGDKNPEGRFTGDSIFANYNLATPLGQGFQTPLGSLHRFQGFADQFLRTPDSGVQDVSLLARHDFSKIGAFDSVRIFARHHWFRPDTSGEKYGTEWNASISGQYDNIILSLEYSDYRADSFSTDTRSLFLTTQLRF